MKSRAVAIPGSFWIRLPVSITIVTTLQDLNPDSRQDSSARGGSDVKQPWNIDGVNSTDPVSIGASPEYYDFDAFEEIQVASGGNDASVQTSGVVVNIVSKRAGNNWAGNGSGYFVNHDLQGNNTPEELVDAGVERSNRINEVWEWGFDVGGPIVKDKFFAWGAYRRNQINLFTRNTNPDRRKYSG